MSIIYELITVIIAIVAISLFLQFVPLSLWVTALAARVEGVNPGSLIGMRLRKIRQEKVVLPLIAAQKAGVPVSLDQLEAHYMARGNVDNLVRALISANRNHIAVTFDQLAGMDLMGQDVLQTVNDAHQAERSTL